LAGAVGLLAGGPVAGAFASSYALLVVRGWLGGRRNAKFARDFDRQLDEITTAAADLRAGLPATVALGALCRFRRHHTGRPGGPVPGPVGRRDGAARAGRLVGAAHEVAERIGAPLAEILDRIDADLRAQSRLRAAVAAQVEGARATAVLLAALPLGGVAIGYTLGVDMARTLLHTPVGAGCALAGLVLQCAGLAWSHLLCRGAVETTSPSQRRWPAGERGSDRDPVAGRSASRWSVHGAAVLVAVSVALVVPGWPGAVSGVVAAVATHRLLCRLEPVEVRRRRLAAGADLPVAIDLLGAALRTGAPPQHAASTVGEALAGPVGQRLTQVGAALSAGQPPDVAWALLAGIEGGGRVARAAVHSAERGSALASLLTRLGDEARAARAARAEAAARRAGVLVVLPLGLCFLPAFLLIGVAPVVLAVLRTALI
jgi:Flp pilus assembly protein TadB